MGPLQPEQGSSVVTSASGGNSGNTDANGNMGSSVTVSSPPRVVLWTRLPGNNCKVKTLWEGYKILKNLPLVLTFT